jgi:hypothetical protein
MQVTPKTIDSRIVQCGDRDSFTIYPMNEVFRRKDMRTGTHFCVACLAQLFSKAFKQRTSMAIPEFSNAYRRSEQLCEHDALL